MAARAAACAGPRGDGAPGRDGDAASGPERAGENLIVMAGGLAHDLNNLLTGVLGSVALARAALAGGQSAEPFLSQIESAALCAGDLCRRVLVQAGRGTLASEQVHLSRLVAQMLPLLQLAIGGRARLKLQLVDELPLVLAAAAELRQVLLNLVTNAAESVGMARREGGEVLIATRLVQLDADSLRGMLAAPEATAGPHVALRICDNGIGMEPQVLARVFEPYFTTKLSSSPSGRGLGLTIVREVVRGLKGALKVRSAPGQGADFELLFPCAVAPAAALPPEASQAPQAPAAPASPGASDVAVAAELAGATAILVVDDEPTVREFTARVLRTAGYRVLAVSGKLEALAVLEGADGEAVGLAIIDWALGRHDGEAVARALHARRPELPLCILSGYGPNHYRDRLRGLPIAGTLQKPFRAGDLLGLVPFPPGQLK